jgi:hypothetical protein
VTAPGDEQGTDLIVIEGDISYPHAEEPTATVAKARPEWYGVAHGCRVVLLPLVQQVLREVSEEVAAREGRRMHHAGWFITRNQAAIDKVLDPAHCVLCADDAHWVRAHLASDPQAEVAVGLVYFAVGPNTPPGAWAATMTRHGGLATVENAPGMFVRKGGLLLT